MGKMLHTIYDIKITGGLRWQIYLILVQGDRELDILYASQVKKLRQL